MTREKIRDRIERRTNRVLNLILESDTELSASDVQFRLREPSECTIRDALSQLAASGRIESRKVYRKARKSLTQHLLTTVYRAAGALPRMDLDTVVTDEDTADNLTGHMLGLNDADEIKQRTAEILAEKKKAGEPVRLVRSGWCGPRGKLRLRAR